MLQDLWEENQIVVFVGNVVTELSETLGFHYLQPRNRFWELLEQSGITPTRIITRQERKALAEGHRDGNLSEPVRLVFIEKKTSQLRRLGIGLTDLNRRVVVADEKDKAAVPTDDDIRKFITRVEKLRPKIVAFVTTPEVFTASFEGRHPEITVEPGPEPFTIGSSEVWFLGSTSAKPRGEAIEKQDDAFFALGEKVDALRKGG